MTVKYKTLFIWIDVDFSLTVSCDTGITCMNDNTIISVYQGRQTGGGWGGLNPSEFWMGGLNACQPPLILRKIILGGGWLPLN